MIDLEGQQADVCIVGSGAGGGSVAMQLAEAGARVVVLEKGPWLGPKDFPQDEILSARRDLWAPFESEEPHVWQEGDGGAAHSSRLGWIASCVGGGTVHMGGFFFRLHPGDFAMAKRYPKLKGAELADWPIDYAALAPYYDRVERAIGVSGKASEHPHAPPRSGDYPLPPLRENPLSALVDRGAAKVGAHAFSTPRAILSRAYNGRAPCAYHNFCGGYGCEIGAKSSVLDALIPQAVKTGRCEVRAGCMAFEVTTDKTGRATGVSYYDDKGAAKTQRARLVVVSATAIESARLLLNSTSARFPRGLGNGAGLVGKHLTFSTLAKGYGEFAVDALPQELRGRHPVHFLQRTVQDDYYLGGDAAGDDGYDKGGTANFLLPHRNPIHAAERLSSRSVPALWGAELQRALSRYHRDVREIEVEVFAEFLPTAGTRVEIDPQVKDRWGIPSARIHHQHHARDLTQAKHVLDRALSLLKAAGAQRAQAESSPSTTHVLQHGTCRFGKDPASSVLDPDCRSHEVDNLYVVDGSFMPSSGAVPTTLTIMANAFRVAESIGAHLKAVP